VLQPKVDLGSTGYATNDDGQIAQNTAIA